MSMARGLALLLICAPLAQEAHAEGTFELIPREYRARPDSILQIDNMPRVRSQGGLGFCYSFVAATLIDEANCSARNVANCAAVPDSEKASVLDLARFGRKPADNADRAQRLSYSGLRYGGNPEESLYNGAIRANAIVRESCAPFERLTSDIRSRRVATILDIRNISAIEKAYRRVHPQVARCGNCAAVAIDHAIHEIRRRYDLAVSDRGLAAAFEQDSYSKFLDRLLIPEACRTPDNFMRLVGGWQIANYPDRLDGKSEYYRLLAKIREVLASKRPLGINFCAEDNLRATSMKSCGKISVNGRASGYGHTAVITGYRLVCTKEGRCRDSLQIVNSWGEAWQAANDGGWIGARPLLDRTFYEPEAIFWLEPAAR
ncbi:hypothetical protein D9M71_69930 [compost metagenome]